MKTPDVNLTLGGVLGVALLAGLGLAGLTLYLKRKEAGEALSGALAAVVDASKYVNPASAENLAYQAASIPAAGSLGARVWEFMHPNQTRKEAETIGVQDPYEIPHDVFSGAYGAPGSPFQVGA